MKNKRWSIHTWMAAITDSGDNEFARVPDNLAGAKIQKTGGQPA
jgi:hypothetical protein